jgi:hypothetical protein
LSELGVPLTQYIWTFEFYFASEIDFSLLKNISNQIISFRGCGKVGYSKTNRKLPAVDFLSSILACAGRARMSMCRLGEAETIKHDVLSLDMSLI